MELISRGVSRVILITAIACAFLPATAQTPGARPRLMTQDNVVAGTVTYRQVKPLPASAVVTVKLLDVSRAARAMTIAEHHIEASGKKKPFAFDFAYDRDKILAKNRYALRAEISDGDKLLYVTERGYEVITLGNPRVVNIVVVPVGESAAGGSTLSLSKYGTGSLLLDSDRLLIVRAVVRVQTDGQGTVTVSGVDSPTTFSGKATFLDAGTVRIRVTRAGGRRADGTIEIRYKGGDLTSITSSNLTIDGQSVALRF